jgi:hypothetical protein
MRTNLIEQVRGLGSVLLVSVAAFLLLWRLWVVYENCRKTVRADSRWKNLQQSNRSKSKYN